MPMIYYIWSTYTNKLRTTVEECDLQETCHDLDLYGVEYCVLTASEYQKLISLDNQ